MKISNPSYPVVRTPSAPTPRRDEARVEGAPPLAAPPVARPVPPPVELPNDMLQARLRGSLFEGNSSFANQQALAQYADVAQRDESSVQVEVLGIDAYV